MGWLAAIKSARYWAVLIVTLCLVLGVFGWGYTKGSSAQEIKMQAKMNQALSEQLARLKTAHESQMKAQQSKSRREQQLERNINEITRPGHSTCDAGGDWLRAITDSLRAAEGASISN